MICRPAAIAVSAILFSLCSSMMCDISCPITIASSSSFIIIMGGMGDGEDEGDISCPFSCPSSCPFFEWSPVSSSASSSCVPLVPIDSNLFVI